MPFIRNNKGLKVPFSTTRLSALVSLIYTEGLGSSKVSKHRMEIQKMCFEIYNSLSESYGSDQDSEWPGHEVRSEIERYLRDKAPIEVHEAFISMKISELQENKKQVVDNYQNNPVINDKIDPVWAISGLPASKVEVEKINNKNELGFPATSRAEVEKKEQVYFPRTQRKSDWVSFFKSIGRLDLFSWPVWERHINSITQDQMVKSTEDWWSFWHDQIAVAMTVDPRVYELKRALYDLKIRSRVTNQFWFSGSKLYPNQLSLDRTHAGNARYSSLAIHHLQSVFKDFEKAKIIDWQAIKRAIKPERDLNLSWHALQDLESSECLWSLGSGQATEMPQWSFMRFAIAMALKSPDDELLSQDIVSVYNIVSMLSVLPSASAIRDAGKINPKFMEDQAVSVDDDFESIQNAIYDTAVNTKWTGSVSSDWSKIRAKGSSVQNGRRRSAGPIGFVKAIDENLRAQGRVGDDRPATVIIPAWHLDSDDFSRIRHENSDRLQVVVSIPDLLMTRVNDKGAWNLFDPVVYPEVLSGSSGIIEAEKMIQERKKQYPEAHREVSADRYWRKIISQSRLGSPFLIFPESDKPFSSLPDLKTINGLDGVGSFPILDGDKKISWPAIAVNISNLISDSGQPMLDEMRETLTWAYWISERMYDWCEADLSESTKKIRPLCLGAIGFYEAVSKASFGVDHDPEMVSVWVSRISESWATLTSLVDQLFCQKYGPAEIWKEDVKKQSFHPVKMMLSLKKSRNGSLGSIPPTGDLASVFSLSSSGHRFTTRLLWAPFKQASIWASVSPGGFGTLFPVTWVVDDIGSSRIIPTPFMLNSVDQDVQNVEKFGQVLANPGNPSLWPQALKKISNPDQQEWRSRLNHAALVRPWIDQGVSVTLPAGLSSDQTSMLAQQAWWMGLSGVRFEDPFVRPSSNKNKNDDN